MNRRTPLILSLAVLASIGLAGSLALGQSGGESVSAPSGGAASRFGGGSGGVDAGTTGDYSELIQKVPVAPSPGGFRTVMRLKPPALPNLTKGDDLRVSAELAVTTDCHHPHPRCTGNPHTYDPWIDTELQMRAGGRSASLATDRSRCVQQPKDRQHHCIISFHGIEAGAVAGRLECDGDCRIEMLVRAHNPRAHSGDVLVIGGQDKTGKLKRDKGRINAIRLRGRPDRRDVREGLERSEVPPDLRKRVVISTKLDRLGRGDVIEAWVDLRASVSHLPYHALVGSEIVLGEQPTSRNGKRFVSRVANLGGHLTEGAGTNCTQAQTPCPVFRTGVLEMREDSVNPRGRPRPLYLNVVVRANNKLKPERPGDMIRLRDHGGLQVRVYSDSAD